MDKLLHMLMSSFLLFFSSLILLLAIHHTVVLLRENIFWCIWLVQGLKLKNIHVKKNIFGMTRMND